MSFWGSSGLATLQGLVLLALGLVALALQIYALADAVRQRADGFVAAGKQTKQIWLIILGVAVAIGFVTITNPLNFFDLIAFVAAAVYLADVRPAVGGTRGGGGRTGYGPW